MLVAEGDGALPGAFYERLSENEFRATDATASPWDSALQHGGPPAALLARAALRTRPDELLRVGRVTVDMLGGIPRGVVRTEAEVVRPGKRVELVAARLWVDGKLAVTGTVWRIRVDPGVTAEHADAESVPVFRGLSLNGSSTGSVRTGGMGGLLNGGSSVGATPRLGARRSGPGFGFRWSKGRSPCLWSGFLSWRTP
ncbi:acyl-CoA thioesterase domain-containing protein [Actinoplanes couchii]|uniref:Acyl-CoA thioesterase-like N-terminal HotDog domain-containing protein n=1 Tax=Actinoplanes couchii TaxID=403638 RepID=A0ABQ3X8A8_9ACTN|nr:acyl-CoA thioesterase domain-containing protein [Actinoplanes couchii]GID54731.1 hypothetical protein Aco03nite_031350 [Actinoplanes couchii]